MNFMIMGAGAVGSYFGGLMAEKGLNVTLVARGKHLDMMQHQGLLVHSINGDFRTEVNAVSDPKMAVTPDVVFITTKSYSTLEAAQDLREAIDENTLVISLQNGLGNVEKLRDTLYPQNVIPGVIHIGAYLEEPGVVKHTALGKIVFGRENGEMNPKDLEVCEILKSAGIKADISKDINSDIWKKLAWNAAFNGITALTQTTISEAVKNERLNTLLTVAMQEVAEIAAKTGCDLGEDFIEESLKLSEQFENTSTSMLRDMLRKRPLEIDAMCGAIVKMGHQHEVLTPVNFMLYSFLSVFNDRHNLKMKS